jgi:hypothetical protein
VGLGRLDDLRAVVTVGAMTPRVDVFVGPAHDLVHTSLVLTGFCELAARGAIALRYHHPRQESDRWLAGDPMVIVFDVDAAGSRRIAIDLRDGEGISYPIIERVEIYFKRAFYAPECDRLGPLGAKIRPFGLNFPCRSARSAVRLLTAIGGPIALTGRSGLHRVQQYLGTAAPEVFEQGPDVPLEPAVAFQPRLWRQDEIAAGESDLLNRERVEMVRALKRAFGARFIGGLVPTAFAREHFPDDLTPHSSKYADYLRIKKRCLISVYTRGVEHSLAFKLGETVAASQCLVSVPLRYQLPRPLEAGRHYLEFETAEQCIDACQRLLDDPVLAREMRHANHRYYREQVEPAAHLARVLDQVTGSRLERTT